MAHLKSFREGWNHERFAQFVLGKVSFISTPDTIGDDTGFDISGFFIKPHPTKPRQILPYLPYALQVKPHSWHEPDYIEKHLHELAVIGVPYYIGIVRPDSQTIDIYSGKGLQALFSLHDWEDLVTMVASGSATVRNELAEDHQGIPARRDGDNFTVILYKVTELTMTSGHESDETKKWVDDCQDSMNTIWSAKAGEFIFHGPRDQYTQWIGVGTFIHALRRFMHASAALAEELHHGNRFMSLDENADDHFLRELGGFANQLINMRNRLCDKGLVGEIIDEQQWEAWVTSVISIANSAGSNIPDPPESMEQDDNRSAHPRQKSREHGDNL